MALAEWLTLVGIVTAVFVGLFPFFYDKILVADESRRHFASIIQAGKPLEIYRDLNQKLLNVLQGIYGGAASGRAFMACFVIAYFYPILFFLAAYSWGGASPNFLDSYVVIANSSLRRELLLPLLAVSAIFFLLLMRFHQHIDFLAERYIRKIMPSIIPARLILYFFIDILVVLTLAKYVGFYPQLLLAFLVIALFFAVAHFPTLVGLVLVFSDFFTGGVGFGGYLFMVIALGIFVAFKLRLDLLFIALLFSSIILAFFNYLDLSVPEWSLFYIFFFLAMPLVNAFLDWVSWYFSRLFLERAQHEDSKLKIFFDILYDLGIAVLSMLLLCVLLPITAHILNVIYAQFTDQTFLDWRAIALDVKTDPWGDGLMYTLMLVTTLLPTLLHIVLALLSLVLKSFAGDMVRQRLAAYEIQRSHLHLFGASGLMLLYAVGVASAMFGLWVLIESVLSLQIASGLYWVAISVGDWLGI